MALNFLKSGGLQQIAFVVVALTVILLFYHLLINSAVQNQILVTQDRNLNATLKNQNTTIVNQGLILESLREVNKITSDNPQTTLEEQRQLFQDVRTALNQIEVNQNLTKDVLQEQINQLKPPRATEERQIKAEQDHFNQTVAILNKIGVSANETQLQAREIQENATDATDVTDATEQER